MSGKQPFINENGTTIDITFPASSIELSNGSTLEAFTNKFRKANTTYSVGDVAYNFNLPTGFYLECTTGGKTTSGQMNIGTVEAGTNVSDGTVGWTIRKFGNSSQITSLDERITTLEGNPATLEDLYSSLPAAAHNGLYRGKDLTEYFNSGEMSKAIAKGTFDDIFIGDYIVKNVTANNGTYEDVRWLVAAIDPHIHCGDTETTAHHVLVIPDTTLQRNVYMNSSNTTEGGYTGSYMWKTCIPGWVVGIKNAFGAEHVLEHRELLCNAISGNTTSNWAWVTVSVNIPNESMVYGKVWGSGGHNSGDFPRMLPLFALKCGHLWDKQERSWFWLRDVSSSATFALALGGGVATSHGASDSFADGGVRPYFLLR